MGIITFSDALEIDNVQYFVLFTLTFNVPVIKLYKLRHNPRKGTSYNECAALCSLSHVQHQIIYSNKSITLPANLILMRSKGCRIRVDATPPDMPATRCSYFTWLKTVIFRLGPEPPVAFIVVISCPELIFLHLYCKTDASCCSVWLDLFVTSSCITSMRCN
jgi:hypothetical protein